MGDLNLPQEIESGYGQILSVLARRSLWIAGSILVSTSISIYSYLQKEPTYVSSMQLLIEPNYQEQERANRAGIDGSTFTQTRPFEIDYATQIMVMRGSELLEKAADDLRQSYPEITVDDIKEKLRVLRSSVLETPTDTQESATNIIQVDYTSSDPEKSRRVVEALKRVYLDYNLEQQQLRLQRGLAFIDQQLPLAQRNLSETERSLRQFREANSVIDPEQRASDLAATIDQVKQERQLVRADFEESVARYEELSRQIGPSSPQVGVSARLSESTRYQNLLDAYQETELALEEQRGQFTDDSTYVRRLQRQLAGQKQLLKQEAERVLGRSDIPEEQLLQEGQLGQTDLDIFRELKDLEASIQGLASRDASLASTENQLLGELAAYPSLIKEYNQLQPEIEIQQETLQGLLGARQEVSIDIAKGGMNWQVIESPQMGVKKGPNLKIDLALGVITGLFVGIALAFFRETTDSRLRNVEQVSTISPVSILGSVPELDYSKLNLYQRIIEGTNNYQGLLSQLLDRPQFRSSFQKISGNLAHIKKMPNCKVIAVTSALRDEGKTTIAFGMSLASAQQNQKVLLIDANFNNPMTHRILDIDNDEGLLTALSGKTSNPTIHRMEISDSSSDVLISGTDYLEDDENIYNSSFKKLIKQLKEKYDLILVDTSDLFSDKKALSITSMCDACVLVVRTNQVSQGIFRKAISMLSMSNLLGIVINFNSEPVDISFTDLVEHVTFQPASH